MTFHLEKGWSAEYGLHLCMRFVFRKLDQTCVLPQTQKSVNYAKQFVPPNFVPSHQVRTVDPLGGVTIMENKNGGPERAARGGVLRWKQQCGVWMLLGPGERTREGAGHRPRGPIRFPSNACTETDGQGCDATSDELTALLLL